MAARMAPPTATRLFVYGTLLEGQPNSGLLTGLPRRSATLAGRLFFAPAGYPALVPDPGGRPIHGEVVEIDPGRLAVLDLLERVEDGLYQRTLQSVRPASGPPLQAYAYTVTADEAKRRAYRPLEVGDWRRVALSRAR